MFIFFFSSGKIGKLKGCFSRNPRGSHGNLSFTLVYLLEPWIAHSVCWNGTFASAPLRGHSQTGTLMHFLHRRAPIWFSWSGCSPQGAILLCLVFFYYFQISGYRASVKNRDLEGKIRFGSSSKPVWVGFSCSPHASELRDKHGHYVLLSEGARVQIHISIFFVLIPICGDVHLCWTHVINQLSAAFSEAAVHISVPPARLLYPRPPQGSSRTSSLKKKKNTFNTSDDECGKKGMSEE